MDINTLCIRCRTYGNYIYPIKDKMLCDICIKELNQKVNEDYDAMRLTERDFQSPEDRIADQLVLNSPSMLKAHLDQNVIGQDNAKKVLCNAIYLHYRRKLLGNDMLPKHTVLVVGPTGSGKTYMAEMLAKKLNLPFGIADAAQVTEIGYWGADVPSLLTPMLVNADKDAERAAYGIVYIDEIDKIAQSAADSNKVTEKGVQRELLKILDGQIISVPTQVAAHNRHIPSIEVDTKNILFIFGGAFSGINNILDKRINSSSSIGFNRKEKLETTYKEVLSQDVVNFGFMPELVGRFNAIATLEKLSSEELAAIIKNNASHFSKYKELFKSEGRALTVTDDIYKKIAELALNFNIGARGIPLVLNKLFESFVFDSEQKDVTITSDLIDSIFKSTKETKA